MSWTPAIDCIRNAILLKFLFRNSEGNGKVIWNLYSEPRHHQKLISASEWNELTAKIDSFLRKAVRWGYGSRYNCLTDLMREADLHLFCKMTSNSGHCIHQLLPPTKVLPMKLRDSRCVFALPQCHYNLYKHSFVLRNLFVSAYWMDVRWRCIFFVFFNDFFWFWILCSCYVMPSNLLMAFDRLLLKRLLTYLLTYILNIVTLHTI